MTDRLARILDLCLEDLRRGASLEEVLARYPEEADELRSLLTVAEGLRSGARGVEPRPQFLASLLIRVLSQPTPRPAPAWRPALAAAFGGLAVALGGLLLAWAIFSEPQRPTTDRVTVELLPRLPSQEPGLPLPPSRPATPERPPAAPTEELVTLLNQVEGELRQIQEQASQGAPVAPSLVRRQRENTQALVTAIQLLPKREVEEVAPQVLEVVQQQQEVLPRVKEQLPAEVREDAEATVRLAAQALVAIGAAPATSPSPEATATPSPGPAATPTPEPAATPAPTPTATPGPSPTPSPAPTATPSPGPTAMPSPGPTAMPSP